uniref:PNP_UDP_1 domain-containing protein n=1 Tax=Parastrongyloides trichosuri TaxID=131310 RepID=A0A0N5A2I6_PARTI
MSIEKHSLIVLKPIIRSPTHNVIRIEREQDLNTDEILHLGGGDHAGVVINKFTGTYEELNKIDLIINFSVWLTIPSDGSDDNSTSSGDKKKQEIRIIKFIFVDGVEVDKQHEIAENIFKDIITHFPRDYLSFIKRILKFMEDGNEEINIIEIDMKFADENEAIEMPNEDDSEQSEIEIKSGHVQELLEHAFPNGLKVETMAEALKVTKEEIETFLNELKDKRIVEKVENEDNEWIRVEERHIDQNIAIKKQSLTNDIKESPTIAIITSFYNEKQAIDRIIENRHTFHKYQSSGESNVYTTGTIGPHRVVATKLARGGKNDVNTFITASGGTTRLLGNYQNVEHVIILGSGGAVTNFSNIFNSNVDSIKLGDVVVANSKKFSDTNSPSYVYANSYTLNRDTDEVIGYNNRLWHPTDNILAQIASQTNNDASLMEDWELFTKEIIDTLNESTGGNIFSKPTETDVMKVPVGGGNFVVVPHQNPDRTNSMVHVGPIGGMASFPKKSEEHNESIGNDSFTISSEQQKDSIQIVKDKFTKEHNLKAIDAGFDTVISAIHGSCIGSWSIICGITDYQNGQSRSGKIWQPYAAARVAGLVKAILERLPPS